MKFFLPLFFLFNRGGEGVELSLANKCLFTIIGNYPKIGKEIKKKVDIQYKLIEIRQGGHKISGRISKINRDKNKDFKLFLCLFYLF